MEKVKTQTAKKGRALGDMSTKEGMWKLLINQKKTDKKHRIDSSSQPLEVNYLPCQSFGLLDFRLVKVKRYFIVHAIFFALFCYRNPSKSVQ